jgi:glycosyltransferase involved in cell wall biosynthesis
MLEAGLCGLPTIASALEGITDVVREGENGHLVSSLDADAFRSAIVRYYNDPSLLTSASSRAREYTLSRFGWSRVVDQYISELEKLSHCATP